MSQSPPAYVLELIDRFDPNRDSYKPPHYNETQRRRVGYKTGRSQR